jgi:hypothetical protein
MIFLFFYKIIPLYYDEVDILYNTVMTDLQSIVTKL